MVAVVSFFPSLLIYALASRVSGFNVTANSQNLTTSQILDVPDGVVKTSCLVNCTSASSQIQACKDDANCLCRADTVVALLNCEQCMFDKLIAVNQRMDFRVGSQAVLAGYAASCKAAVNLTLATNQTTLQLPNNWNGPFNVVIPIAGTIITVMAGVFFGCFGVAGVVEPLGHIQYTVLVFLLC